MLAVDTIKILVADTTSAIAISNLSIEIIGTIVGGIILSVIFFIFREKILYQSPNISGLWTFRATTKFTAYNPYKGMKLFYLVFLTQEGNKIWGSGEKFREELHNGRRDYHGKSRSRIVISGNIIKHYFTKNDIHIQITEESSSRKSSTIQRLKIRGDTFFDGTFVSTIANSMGDVYWEKGNEELFRSYDEIFTA
jgi:hypothetical protein